MHIVQLANYVTPTSGGQRVALEALANQYIQNGNHCTLITPGKKLEHYAAGRRRFVSLPGVPVPFSGGYRAIIQKSTLQEMLTLLKPDLVELSDKTTLSWVPEWCANSGIACVLFSHERASNVVAERFPKWLPVGSIFKRWEKNIENYTQRIVCASQYSADEYSHLKERVRIVPLGVDHKVFHVKPDSPKAADHPTVLFAGRLSYEKRPHLALLTVRELSMRGVHVTLKIAGDGPMRRKLAMLSDGLDVEFLGHISSRQQLAELMSSADVAICPSPLETFGLSVLEILACGTPVVVADSGAGMEIVNKDCGEISELSIGSMADAVERILSKPRNSYREQCVARASKYSWSICANSMLKLFEELTATETRVAA
jgi:alpha-1,6-mannosyltransferase